jgi:hypothetical protein
MDLSDHREVGRRQLERDRHERHQQDRRRSCGGDHVAPKKPLDAKSHDRGHDEGGQDPDRQLLRVQAQDGCGDKGGKRAAPLRRAEPVKVIDSGHHQRDGRHLRHHRTREKDDDGARREKCPGEKSGGHPIEIVDEQIEIHHGGEDRQQHHQPGRHHRDAEQREHRHLGGRQQHRMVAERQLGISRVVMTRVVDDVVHAAERSILRQVEEEHAVHEVLAHVAVEAHVPFVCDAGNSQRHGQEADPKKTRAKLKPQ